MAENKKFTKLINSDGTKQAVALDKVSFDAQTKKLTLYSSVDNSIKEETTIPASEVDTTLSKSGLAADAKATGDAVKDVVKVGGTASSFTGIIVGTQEEEIELVEQKDFDAEIAKLNAKVGAPLVANTASAMVNTTKIYVYTGNESGYVNGNWYFYNGTNWESGGVYNAVAVQTDKTLTQENMPADAKKTGDELTQLKSELSELSDNIGQAPKTQIASISPSSIYIILDSSQLMRFEDGKKYDIKVTITESVTSGVIAVSKTSSASGSFITYENNTAISAGVHTYRFEYTEDMGRSLYLILYLDGGYAKCTNVSIELVDDTTIRTLINNNTEDISTLNAPVEKELTSFAPTALYSILDSPQLLRFKNGKKYALRITIDEAVTSGTIALSNSSSASGTVYTFVSNSAIAQGEYRYVFEYDSSWTTAGIYLRLALDGGYAKCTQVVLAEVVADDINAYGKVLGDKIEAIESEPTKYKYAIDSVLCIGDSLTEGIYDGGQYSPIKQGYPYYIGRMINTDVTNGGYNGYTAQTWYNDKSNLYTYTDYNFVVIWLGTNGGLTDTLDTDVNPYTDYNDYADNNTGCYCKIIEKIKEENPHCMIMLCNCFAGTTKAVTNAVISKIADKYGLIVADMSDMGTNNHPEWHNGNIPVHFGKAGYLMSAKRIIDTASAYFEENPIRCEFGLSAFTRQ